MKRTLSLKACATSIVVLMTLAAASEFSMGRRLWGINGKPGLWSGDIWSNHNSQYLTDPYSFTHITHGILLYGVLRVFTNTSPASMRLIVAVGLESAWEVLENTDLVIQRYRAETISLNYYGDSILNSMGDIATCMLGFLLALRLPKRAQSECGNLGNRNGSISRPRNRETLANHAEVRKAKEELKKARAERDKDRVSQLTSLVEAFTNRQLALRRVEDYIYFMLLNREVHRYKRFFAHRDMQNIDADVLRQALKFADIELLKARAAQEPDEKAE